MSNRRVDEDKRATLRRFAALGAATPLVGLGGGDDGDDDSSGSSDARDAIVGYVASTPGAHFSKVRDDLQLGTGETQYHLRNLVDDDTLEVSRDGDYKRFFPADRFSEFEQVALGYLRRDTPRGMLVHLLRDPAATGSELAARLGVSRATVSTYAKELDAVGLLSRADGYAVRNPETVITLLIRYADSFGSDAAAFADDAAELIRFDP
ncbi:MULTISPECIES: MarR family transcriptional regulator [unclassified Haloferax]|uniref:winged helix-turn-helix transcriptional regulator n=1 Tax=Haloferax TaxID=2251 RepID=UPI0002AFCF49|nr:MULTISPECIES: MarR family transcriptional regulator [unclassified Haloferax]ELZ58779.1 transcriptional regulator [Haloferax sp. ATCC BAA-646]ELZ62794.1 transcriptional regulator [Haloferax sp. ATCC BAA-644]ELZ64866.1 transcriptional regulator [Haloferax sp. ATCC BAA-645]